jgi:hypothetical protein
VSHLSYYKDIPMTERGQIVLLICAIIALGCLTSFGSRPRNTARGVTTTKILDLAKFSAKILSVKFVPKPAGFRPRHEFNFKRKICVEISKF